MRRYLLAALLLTSCEAREIAVTMYPPAVAAARQAAAESAMGSASLAPSSAPSAVAATRSPVAVASRVTPAPASPEPSAPAATAPASARPVPLPSAPASVVPSTAPAAPGPSATPAPIVYVTPIESCDERWAAALPKILAESQEDLEWEYAKIDGFMLPEDATAARKAEAKADSDERLVRDRFKFYTERGCPPPAQ